MVYIILSTVDAYSTLSITTRKLSFNDKFCTLSNGFYNKHGDVVDQYFVKSAEPITTFLECCLLNSKRCCKEQQYLLM